MLILTRRVNECLVIDDEIRVHVLDVKGYQVRLGIDAPAKVVIQREEIHARIQAEAANRSAAKTSPSD